VRDFAHASPRRTPTPLTGLAGVPVTPSAVARPELARKPTPAERAVLCAALGLEAHDRPLDAHAHAADAIGWPFILVYARQHLVLPLLARAALASPRFAAEIGDDLRETFEHAALQNELQNRLLLADLALAVAALEREGLHAIALKGAGLLAQHPALVQRRHTEDIDLWVDPERAEDAYRILLGKGYREVEGIPAVLRYGGEASPTPAREGPYYQLPGLVSPRGTPLEIHRRPPTTHRAVSFDAALRDAVPVVVDGVTVHVRDARRMLGDLSGHVVVHHYAVPWLWPRHLIDVSALLERAPDLVALAAPVVGVVDRLSIALTAEVLAQVRAPAHGEGALARRLVFPVAPLGWGLYRLACLGVENVRRGPRSVARAVWPSEAFLRSQGFDPSRGRWRAHLARLRDVAARAASR
jgi:hypothetical protein